MAIYGVYERDQFVFEGKPQEVAKRLGIKIDTVLWYSTPTGIKRMSKLKKRRREIMKLED